jgi:AcrR family transcriptional regulator
MPALIRPLPRKLPSQARSRETVERILDATARILIADGYAAASTNRIAAEAGVSPGSVYQYFPNKDAIVLATVERMTNQLADEMIEQLRLPQGADRNPRRAVEAVLSALLDAMEQRRELVHVVVEQLPRLGGSPALQAFERRVRDLATGYLAGFAQGAGGAPTAASAWMTVQCVEQLTIRYVIEQPPIPREEFIKELRRLVTRYTAGALAG